MPTHYALNDLPEIRGQYRQDVDMSRITWFNAGGSADIVFRPKDPEDLSAFLANKPDDLPVTVIGVGSNILVRDGGIDGVVIRLGRGFNFMNANGNQLTFGSSTLGFNAAHYAANHGIGGIEFLVGIPGTIGGALAMNAGAYGNEVASVLVHADAIDEGGTLHRLYPDDIGYVYRGQTLPDGMIFTQGTFQGDSTAPEIIKEKLNAITTAREATQPIKSRTSGSTFKNPSHKKAWELIDEAGCRGLRVGDAQVSEQHCNFLLNKGHATASDIEALGELVKNKVFNHSGVTLEWEIKIIGRKND